MTPTYQVTLVNLAADARSAAVAWDKIERPGVSDEEMRRLLENFCAIDAVENAAADPEIRVQVRRESYLIRSGQGKLVLYDVLNRDLPGRSLAVAEVMAELDGSAIAARTVPPMVPAEAGLADEEPAVSPPAARLNPRRVIALAVAACVLGGAHFWWRIPSGAEETPAALQRMDAAEAARVRATLAGVYMTGTQPGEHGIVLTDTEEVRLFELRAVDAPLVIHAAGEWGHVGPALNLATDQPGGLIRIPDPETLIYCGETYKRIR
ncbi:MAG TPA: hypothetical protein VLT83_01155 [Opitutaceae bacterium]|nr:hypothetical protein [Opitutaceae bacterium]